MFLNLGVISTWYADDARILYGESEMTLYHSDPSFREFDHMMPTEEFLALSSCFDDDVFVLQLICSDAFTQMIKSSALLSDIYPRKSGERKFRFLWHPNMLRAKGVADEHLAELHPVTVKIATSLNDDSFYNGGSEFSYYYDAEEVLALLEKSNKASF